LTTTSTHSANISTLLSNAGAQAASLNTIDANLGTATTNITALFSNAATQALTLSNIAEYQTYANANVSSYTG